MRRARILAVFSVWLALIAFMPMGCSNRLGPVRATQNGGIDKPNYPDETIERFRECVADYGSQLPPGSHTLDARMEIDEDGLKYNLEIEKLPESGHEFGGCMRTALQDMVISEKLFEEAKEKLNYQRNQALKAQKEMIGSPAVVVVAGVTVIVTEVVLEAGAITILFATTVELIDKAAKDVAELMKRRKRWENECNEHRTLCLLSSIADLPGGLHKHTLCHMCLDACINSKGTWPSQVDRFDGTMAPCNYWRYGSN